MADDWVILISFACLFFPARKSLYRLSLECLRANWTKHCPITWMGRESWIPSTIRYLDEIYIDPKISTAVLCKKKIWRRCLSPSTAADKHNLSSHFSLSLTVSGCKWTVSPGCVVSQQCVATGHWTYALCLRHVVHTCVGFATTCNWWRLSQVERLNVDLVEYNNLAQMPIDKGKYFTPGTSSREIWLQGELVTKTSLFSVMQPKRHCFGVSKVLQMLH